MIRIFAGMARNECKPESCVGFSSGTATTATPGNYCQCQCHSHLPAFREDLRICVDDIHGKCNFKKNIQIRNKRSDFMRIVRKEFQIHIDDYYVFFFLPTDKRITVFIIKSDLFNIYLLYNVVIIGLHNSHAIIIIIIII